MTKRLPPLFESGTYGCPFCGSPDVEFRDFKQHDRTFAVAGQCHGLGEATARHRWQATFTMTNHGIEVRIPSLAEDFPARPGHATFEEYKRQVLASKPLEQQLRESLIVLGIDPDAPKTEVEKALAYKFDALVLGKKPETQP
jgi:hypothetical protein